MNNIYDLSYSYYYYYLRFNKIVSSKSDKNNYLVCTLFIYQTYKEEYNFTECCIYDRYGYFENCPYIYYSYEKDCSYIETYYFKEVDKFAYVCKRFKKFIVLIIYINCTNDKGYEGKFSSIYNIINF